MDRAAYESIHKILEEDSSGQTTTTETAALPPSSSNATSTTDDDGAEMEMGFNAPNASEEFLKKAAEEEQNRDTENLADLERDFDGYRQRLASRRPHQPEHDHDEELGL